MKKLVCVLAAALIIALFGNLAFSEENKEAAPDQPQGPAQASTPAPLATIPPAPASIDGAGGKELSIYGEVQNIDVAANSLTVQYYDYDNDEEKTIEVITDKDTKIENAATLANIAKSDWVDVAYTVQNAKNIAMSIMVEKEEKEEAQAVTEALAPETKPAGMPEEE